MSERAIVRALLVAFGLYLIAQSATYAGAFLGVLVDSPDSRAFALSSFISLATVSAGGIALIVARNWLSTRIVSNPMDVGPIDPERLVAAGAAVLALFFVATALIDVLTAELTHRSILANAREQVPTSLLDSSTGINLLRARVEAAVSLAIGGVLFFGSGGLARAWETMRSSGRTQGDTPPAA